MGTDTRSGPAGSKIQLRFGEVLKPDGELYTENLRSADATDTYILRGGAAEVFEPHFTFHGFRYIEVTGLPGTPTSDAVEGIVFHTAAPFTIQFKTASAMVNQLWSNILWGQRGNFLSVPTDYHSAMKGWAGWATLKFSGGLRRTMRTSPPFPTNSPLTFATRKRLVVRACRRCWVEFPMA